MSDDRTPKRPLRSAHTYGKADRDGFIHRSWMKSQGLPDDVFDGRPIIGICNTWSELTPCNAGLRDLAEHVKRGVWEAGGLPVEFPVTSLGETQMRPTAMLFRNLLSMDVEESIRGNPIDGVVLLGGCDKTTPGQLMGAASVDLPTMVLSAGPMLNGKFRGRDIGSGTDVWKFSEAVRAGEMTLKDFMSAETGMSRSTGVCMTMGTASTMASLVEAMGLCLPGNASLPAVDSRRKTLAHETGRRIVALVRDDVRLSQIATRAAFENAIHVHAVIGGSTNAIVHLLAIAGRLGVPLALEDFDTLAKDIPLLVDLQPSGKYLMEDFHYAGGVPAAMNRLGDRIHRDASTVGGRTIGDIADEGEIYNDEVIRDWANPVRADSGAWVLRGNLCPQGAIIKPNAAAPDLLRHRGRAVVFETIEDMKARIDDPDLDVDSSSILVLKGCGPKGYPGMPEVGNMPLPTKLLEAGVKDMLRISDARMSGTAFGAVILHVAPESEAGGPLSIVENGDEIDFDGPARRLDLLVAPEEIERRLAARAITHPPVVPARGYAGLYVRHVLQADQGCDFDFLVGGSGDKVTRGIALSGIFIAGDWGTSRLRLSLCDGDGVIDRVEGPGIGQGGEPAAVFADAVAGWADRGPVPAILGGMVGSTLGWAEAPYLDCPADVAALAGALVRFESAGRGIAIAPGLACLNPLGGPDVMRGEETQILGALAIAPALATGRHILCLPGTHGKWVILQDGAVERFQTSLTGELFACLRDHSVLGRDTDGLLPVPGAAFAVGLNRAFDPRRPALGHLLFEARSRRLREHMTPGDALSFLSGLTIGADVAGMLDLLPAVEAVTLVGAPALIQGYAEALMLRHIQVETIDGDAAALAGLRALAIAGGLWDE